MTKEQFTCAWCKQTFDKDWSDEEADAELVGNFPGFDTSECDLICDDCYKQFTRQ